MLHPCEICAVSYIPLPVSFIALILFQSINVPQKICHRTNYNKSSNFSLNLFPVCNDKKTVVNNNDPDNEFLAADVVRPPFLTVTNPGVPWRWTQEVPWIKDSLGDLQIVHISLVRPLGMS